MNQYVGDMEYAVEPVPPEDDSVPLTWIIIGVIIALAVISVLIIGIIIFMKKRMHVKIERERQGWEYKLDKMEGRFRNQCRAGALFVFKKIV